MSLVPACGTKTIIKNVKVCFKLDTGSEAILIPDRTVERMNNIRITPRKCWLVTFTGEKVKPLGETTLRVNGQPLTFQVTPILGKDAFVTLNLIGCIDNITQEKSPEAESTKMINKYKTGTIQVNAKIHTDHSVNHVIDPPRRIPHAIAKKE